MSNSITTSHNADILGGCFGNAFKELQPPFHLRHEFLGIPGQKFLVVRSHLIPHSGLHHLPNILDRIEERRIWAQSQYGYSSYPSTDDSSSNRV
ncbi:unnamed protein product [Dicrocoelium dendriticum]|nr:unnamed protein product [Dicrocoelium dendriticum]